MTNRRVAQTRRPVQKKPAARRRKAQAASPATLTGAHVQGFFAGSFFGALIAGTGILWLTRDAAPPQPIADVQREEHGRTDSNQPRYDFFTVLPEQNLSLGSPSGGQGFDSNKTTSKYRNYLLQAGSFRSFSGADQRRGQLAMLGLESRIQESESENRPLFTVYMGPFASRSALMQAMDRSAQEDIDTIMVEPRD